jgi:hypothetical protein
MAEHDSINFTLFKAFSSAQKRLQKIPSHKNSSPSKKGDKSIGVNKSTTTVVILRYTLCLPENLGLVSFHHIISKCTVHIPP